jgi:hypothetical protein
MMCDVYVRAFSTAYRLPRYRFRLRKAVECVAGTLKVHSPNAEKFIHTKEGRNFWGRHFKLEGFLSWQEFSAGVLDTFVDVKPAILEDLTFRSLLGTLDVVVCVCVYFLYVHVSSR